MSTKEITISGKSVLVTGATVGCGVTVMARCFRLAGSR